MAVLAIACRRHQSVIQCLKFAGIHQHRNRVQRIGFFICVMGKLRDVRFLDFRDIVSDAIAFFHIFYCINKHPGSSFIVLMFIAETGSYGKVAEFVSDGISVCFQYHRKDHCIGKPMWNIIFSAEGMCNCVDISNVGFGEGTACEIGGAEHISSCFNIIAVCVGGIQIFKDQSDSIQGIFSCARCSGISNVGFHCVSQGIHAGGSCDKRRKA